MVASGPSSRRAQVPTRDKEAHRAIFAFVPDVRRYESAISVTPLMSNQLSSLEMPLPMEL